MPDNKREQNTKDALSQDYMLEMMSLPDAPKLKATPSIENNDGAVSRRTALKEEPGSNSPAETTSTADAGEGKESRHKRAPVVQEEYETVFIKLGELNVRNGKAVYIRADFHTRIARIVQTIGGGEVTLTDYVDNVFTHHFKQYEQEIKQSFNKNNKPIF